jgi:hypothetical protein
MHFAPKKIFGQTSFFDEWLKSTSKLRIFYDESRQFTAFWNIRPTPQIAGFTQLFSWYR